MNTQVAAGTAAFSGPSCREGWEGLFEACRDHARALLALRCEAFRAAGIAPYDMHVPASEVQAFASGERLHGSDRAMGEVQRTRECLNAAVRNARASDSPPLLARLQSALGLTDDEALLAFVLYALETTPILDEVARTCAGDPVEAGVTALFLAELVAALDPAKTRALLRALGPGGSLHRHLVIESPGASSPGPRDRVTLEPSLRSLLCQSALTTTDERIVAVRDDPAEGYWDESALIRVRSALALAARRASRQAHTGHANRAFRVCLVGNDFAAARRLLAAVLAEAGQALLAVRPIATAPQAASSLRPLVLALRDASLTQAVILIEDPDPWVARSDAMARIGAHTGPVVFLSRSSLPDLLLYAPDLVEATVPFPSPERREHYLAALLKDAPERDAIAHRIGRNYAAPLEVVEAAVAQARSSPEGLTAASLYTALRDQLRLHIGDFADVVPVGQGLEDLVLPEESLARLREMIAGFRHREKVLRQWGFAAKVGRGGGWTALFYGPPGTGKTMAAGIVARELGLEVYRVDLSRVVDKYIGETEKHLARVFDEAERGQVMLLFDEADSLFGRRTSGGTATDRYANMEVNYLLQRMERYEGVVVLTTNNERLLDEAFRRRLRYTVHFPMPDVAERERIWRGMVPLEAEVEGELDFGWLARTYEMSGGHIRNAVLRAAYMAAEEGGGLSQERLRRAADAEYKALGRVVREQTEEI